MKRLLIAFIVGFLLASFPVSALKIMDHEDGSQTGTTELSGLNAYSATYDPASLAAGTARFDSVTVTGIVTGRAVVASPGVQVSGDCVMGAVWASAADTVEIHWRNVSAVSACNTATSTWVFAQPSS